MASSSSVRAKISNPGTVATVTHDGCQYFLTLRQAYRSPEHIGIRLTKKAHGRTIEVVQYDLKGTLPNESKSTASKVLSDAFDALSREQSFAAGLAILNDLVSRQFCDVCKFQPVER